MKNYKRAFLIIYSITLYYYLYISLLKKLKYKYIYKLNYKFVNLKK